MRQHDPLIVDPAYEEAQLRFEGMLERFTYKPGVKLGIGFQHDRPTITVTTEGDNSRGGPPREFTASRAIRPDLTPEQFRDEMVGLIRWWEQHEAFEWMRWDGDIILEPHDTDGSAIGQETEWRPWK